MEYCFIDAILLFSNMSPKRLAVNEMLIQLTSFPNPHVALRIYLSMFVTSCEGERTFSKLKQIQNCLKLTMGQERMSSRFLLSIESDCFRG